jgi:hypothetical protein
MLPVISDNKWKRFCTRRELPLDQAAFATATCYYGIGFRTRPGTLMLTQSEIIHYSYSWRDTHFAMFEPSIPVRIPLSEINHIVQRHFGFWHRTHLAQPDACFEVFTRAGEGHHLVLQRDGDDFMTALTEAGITFHDENVTEGNAD